MARPRSACVALLTDFGTADPYVGQMKGVLHTLAPEAIILDICHRIPPQDLLRAGFFLTASLFFLPPDVGCVCVVDPGVGTERDIVLARIGGRCILAPDNGLLTMVLRRHPDVELYRAVRFPAPPVPAQSSLFHGRDRFAPLAAALCAGDPPGIWGEPLPLSALRTIDLSLPRLEGSRLHCTCLHVDRFGNCVTDLEIDAWRERLAASPPRMLCIDDRDHALSSCRAYALIPPGDVGLLPGSQGYFELAVQRGSASAILDIAPGRPLELLL